MPFQYDFPDIIKKPLINNEDINVRLVRELAIRTVRKNHAGVGTATAWRRQTDLFTAAAEITTRRAILKGYRIPRSGVRDDGGVRRGAG